MSSTDLAIDVSNLVTHYGPRKILDDISFQARQGEIMVIMGGSGSGKSTLLRHLIGLHQPTSGSIKLLQGGALFNSMTVGENVELPLREHTKLDENTIRIMSRMKLEVVNLAGFESLMPAELSGGMIKRAALARAIVMDPRLLFFDEPSAGLDPVVSAELDELILILRDAMNMTIVVVTHELESAFKIADRITVLDQGRILMSDTVAAVRASDNQRIQSLLNRTPRNENINAEEYMERLTREIF